MRRWLPLDLTIGLHGARRGALAPCGCLEGGRAVKMIRDDPHLDAAVMAWTGKVGVCGVLDVLADLARARRPTVR